MNEIKLETKMNKRIISLAAAFALTACGSSAPKCDDAEVQKTAMKVATQIMQDELLHQLLPRNFYPSYASAKKLPASANMKGTLELVDNAMAKQGMKMSGVRTTGEDEKIRKSSCVAGIAFNNGNTLNLYYSAQYTSDGQVYVEGEFR